MSDAHIRWQVRTIEQFSYVTNTLLAITTAVIGFTLDNLIDKSFSCWSKVLLIIGIFILLVNIGFLLFLIYNRLIDFNTTAQIARLANDEGEKSSPRIQRLRQENIERGELTWRVFKQSLFLFIIGQLFIIIGFAIKIF